MGNSMKGCLVRTQDTKILSTNTFPALTFGCRSGWLHPSHEGFYWHTCSNPFALGSLPWAQGYVALLTGFMPSNFLWRLWTLQQTILRSTFLCSSQGAWQLKGGFITAINQGHPGRIISSGLLGVKGALWGSIMAQSFLQFFCNCGKKNCKMRQNVSTVLLSNRNFWLT